MHGSDLNSFIQRRAVFCQQGYVIRYLCEHIHTHHVHKHLKYRAFYSTYRHNRKIITFALWKERINWYISDNKFKDFVKDLFWKAVCTQFDAASTAPTSSTPTPTPAASTPAPGGGGAGLARLLHSCLDDVLLVLGVVLLQSLQNLVGREKPAGCIIAFVKVPAN